MENNNNNNTQRENVNKVKTTHVRERTTRYTLKPALRVLLIKSGGREGRDVQAYLKETWQEEGNGVVCLPLAYKVLIAKPRMCRDYKARLSMRIDYIGRKALE